MARRSPNLAGVSDLLDALDVRTVELIPVNTVHPAELLPTYEVRLERLQEGEGPDAIGLDEFVQVLRGREADIELFSIKAPSAHFTALMEATGRTLLALVRTSA